MVLLKFVCVFQSLQLPLKRFRPETPFIRSRINSTADTPEHVYIHGQPTPPSPSQQAFRVGLFSID